MQDELKDEVRDMAKKLGAAGMQLLVIDTGEAGGSEGSGGRAGLAALAGRLAGGWWGCRGVRPTL